MTPTDGRFSANVEYEPPEEGGGLVIVREADDPENWTILNVRMLEREAAEARRRIEELRTEDPSRYSDESEIWLFVWRVLGARYIGHSIGDERSFMTDGFAARSGGDLGRYARAERGEARFTVHIGPEFLEEDRAVVVLWVYRGDDDHLASWSLDRVFFQREAGAWLVDDWHPGPLRSIPGVVHVALHYPRSNGGFIAFEQPLPDVEDLPRLAAEELVVGLPGGRLVSRDSEGPYERFSATWVESVEVSNGTATVVLIGNDHETEGLIEGLRLTLLGLPGIHAVDARYR